MRGGWLVLLGTGCSLQWGYDRDFRVDAGAAVSIDAEQGADAVVDALVPLDGPMNVPSSGTFGAPVAYATDVNPVAITIGDFNRDGRPDVATANNKHQGSNINTIGTVSVLLTNMNGTLGTATHYTVGYGPVGIASGDFNRDGKLDLVTTNLAQGMGGNMTILLGDGGGMFGAPTPGAACCSPQGVAAGDLNGDGKLDLAIANYFAVQILIGNGSGGFAAPVAYALTGSPWSVALGDMNNDGKLDVVAGYNIDPNPDSVAVFLGNGNGTVQAATIYNTNKGLNHVALAHLDGDGKLDVITANVSGSGDISVLRGTGTGALLTATHYAMGTSPTQVTIGDFNGDGKPDVAASSDNTAVVRLGNFDGTFGASTGYAAQQGFAVATADFNLDGRADLVVAIDNTVSMLLGQP